MYMIHGHVDYIASMLGRDIANTIYFKVHKLKLRELHIEYFDKIEGGKQHRKTYNYNWRDPNVYFLDELYSVFNKYGHSVAPVPSVMHDELNYWCCRNMYA